MKSLLNWLAAAASLIGLFFTLNPFSERLSSLQILIIAAIVIVFGAAATFDVKEELRRAIKKYKTTAEINTYMHEMLRNSGKCEICSRDASWISDKRIFSLLQSKASRSELTFLVHRRTPELDQLASLGAEVIAYGVFGFEPMTRFTVANAGNDSSSYVAIGHRKPNEAHVIEELDSSHPTYSMARDLIRAIRATNDKYNAN
ncbi:hypothetical protein ACPEH1_07355 [Stenotrophomonas sp. NPDC077421]|uniref:hypothetical protein n=1 Tax=Stenotrophomonas sp. NPDC077421 TaxID=3414699 RepID=UPI003C2E575E